MAPPGGDPAPNAIHQHGGGAETRCSRAGFIPRRSLDPSAVSMARTSDRRVYEDELVPTRLEDIATVEGLLERPALIAAAVPRGTISTWLARGSLQEVIAGLYRRPGGDLAWRTMCRAAALWGGEACALSHHTAAALHGIECFVEEAPIHISATDGRHAPKRTQFKLIVHNPRTLTEKDVTLADGMRITSIERTLLDLAATMSPMALERVIGECLRRGIVAPARLKQLREVGRKRKGSVVYTNVIDLRGKTLVRTDSRLEDRFMKAFVDEELEILPEARWWITKWDMRYRADFAFPKFNVAIEIDSWKYHGNRVAWGQDVMKNNDVVSWGWSVLRFTEMTLGDTAGMARLIRETLVSRGW